MYEAPWLEVVSDSDPDNHNVSLKLVRLYQHAE